MIGTLDMNQPVRRIAAQTDYTHNRIGKIVEIDEVAKRYRVLWTHEANGKAIRGGKGVRTWVQYQAVQPIQTGAESTDIKVKE